MGNSYEIGLNSVRLKEQRLPLLICIFIIGLLGQDANVFGQEEVGRGAIVKELNLKKSVTAIQIDHDDFVWVGTTSGLYRFDGFDFEKLGGDTSGIYPPSTDAIKSLFEDKARHLWIATSKKIYVLTRERDRSLDIASSLPPQLSFQEISNIREVGDEIWVFQNAPEIICFHLTAEDNIRYSRTIKTFTSIPISAYLLNNGSYLIELTVKNHYMLLSPDGDSLETKTPPNENTNFFQDMLSHKLYALASPNLYMVDPEKMSFTKKISFASSFLIPVPGWISSSQRSWGSIWIGSKLGHLIWYTPEKGSYLNLTKLLHDRVFEGRFFSTNVGVEDKNGGLWLGTTLGLVYIKLTALQYFNHLPQPQTVVSKQSFSTRGMVRTHNGDLLVSSYAGLFLYKKNVPVKNYTIWNDVIQGKVDPVVYDFLPERDDILMASEGNSLLRYDYETDSIYRLYSSSYFYHSDDQDVKALQWCFKIFKDHSGIIWLGLNAGLYQYDEKNKMLKAAPVKGATREIGRVTDMVEDSLNTLWLATATGLYSISAERAELKKTNLSYANGPPLQCILSDANGWLWIGTRGHGLFHYHTAKGSLIPFTIEQGLADDLICAIRRGDDNALWISTNQGLSRFDPFRKQFTNFYMEDGLPDNEFNHGSSMKDAEGNLYFGGVNGVVHFHPQKNIFNRPPGHLRISKIITHNGLKGSTTERLYNSYQRPEIKLGYRDKYFTVYFASSDPTPASRENYAYRLSGLDNAWQMNGGKNSIQFTGLQPGKYVLQIKTLHQTEDEDDILEIPVFIAQPYFKQ
ncbi:MAG TPA: triple tyrosine motif-containing protein, partial [Saprospiraceae bacterium]|nr:triple tyrosine motif-containing protein [Saprospiraceae bacterium]